MTADERDRPVTLAQLRHELREAIEDHAPDASFDVYTLQQQVRELRDDLDYLIDLLEEAHGKTREPDDDERIDRYARTYIRLARERGELPTQELLAEEIGVTSRYVRKVGWRRIETRVDELAAEETGTES